MNPAGSNYAFLDEHAKRELRRASLKAIAIPGYQVPYASREMPLARGFGTGGLQLTLSLIGPGDVLKVIDQGADGSVNATNLRDFITRTSPGVSTTTDSRMATLIQTRHRIPETPLHEGQILVFQVPYPCPLHRFVAGERERARMHAEADYARLYVRLYEDLVRYSEISIPHEYPARVHGRYVINPSPIPRFDNPKLHRCAHLNLFGAGREKRIYAVPPYTEVENLAFADVPFRIEEFRAPDGVRLACAACGAQDTYLDEFTGDDGCKRWQCSDGEACHRRQSECAQEIAHVRA